MLTSLLSLAEFLFPLHLVIRKRANDLNNVLTKSMILIRVQVILLPHKNQGIAYPESTQGDTERRRDRIFNCWSYRDFKLSLLCSKTSSVVDPRIVFDEQNYC